MTSKRNQSVGISVTNSVDFHVGKVEVKGMDVGARMENVSKSSLSELSYSGSGNAFEGDRLSDFGLGKVEVNNKTLYDHISANPNLRSALEDVLVKIRDAPNQVTAEEELKKSRLGLWLKNQRFTDWGNLAVNLGRWMGQ